LGDRTETDASKWQNPFHIDDWGRSECIRKYEHYIRNSPELLADLIELKDKQLGCHCKPDECHGDVLMKILNEQVHAATSRTTTPSALTIQDDQPTQQRPLPQSQKLTQKYRTSNKIIQAATSTDNPSQNKSIQFNSIVYFPMKVKKTFLITINMNSKDKLMTVICGLLNNYMIFIY
jgi:hypothetical protein